MVLIECSLLRCRQVFLTARKPHDHDPGKAGHHAPPECTRRFADGYPRGSAFAASLAPGPWPVSAQVYAVINPKRQRMVDFIAQRGGSVSLDVVLASLPELGFKRSHLDSMLAGRTTSSGNVMPPVLRKGGSGSPTSNTATGPSSRQ
jgi:hypothetical protein